MACHCCRCPSIACASIGGPILYIDSNYERVLNPSLVNGTVMGVITPVVGSPFTVAGGCTPATFSLIDNCNTGYVFNRHLLPGYIGSGQVLTSPAQPFTLLAHADGIGVPYSPGGLRTLFYCSGVGEQVTYLDTGVTPAVERTNRNWGCAVLRSDINPPFAVHVLRTETVKGVKLWTINGMEPDPVGNFFIHLDTNTNFALHNTSPMRIGFTINQIGGFNIRTGRAYISCSFYSVAPNPSDGADYLPIQLTQPQLGYVRGDLIAPTAANEEIFRPSFEHNAGNHFHGRLRRLAIYPTLLPLNTICQILSCWN